MKQNFVIFRKTPTKTRYRQIARFLFGVFLAAAYFRAHLYQNAAASPFLREPQVCGKWGALTERRGFRTRRNRLQNRKEAKAWFCLRENFLEKISKILHSTFYILHCARYFTLYISNSRSKIFIHKKIKRSYLWKKS